MSAPLRDPSQVRCLTPAVERVMAWHRQKTPLAPPPVVPAEGESAVDDMAVPAQGPLAGDAVLAHDDAAAAP